MKMALHDMKRNLMTLLARELCVHQSNLQKMLTQTTTQLTERQVRACLARWFITVGIKTAFSSHLRVLTSHVLQLLLSALVHSQQFTSSTVARLLTLFSHRYRLQTSLYKALTVAPADVTSQAHLTSMDPGFVWDAAPLLGLLTEDDLRILLGNPDAVRAWLRHQHQLPETERPAGLPADLRSPRDLCDLLMNIPLLSHALRKSVPAVWEHQQSLSMKVMGRYLNHELGSYETYHEEGLSYALKWKDLAFDFQTKLGMDRQTALRAACRIGVELRRLLDDPETGREYERRKRRFPDPWGVLPFWVRSLP
ncbi:hypothetical protein FJT64_024534 [Amphibalanus amphitrite]|uniref:Uncharacterized protein n=1 Tax=Amphibalanus amphitrite TaxID=1232801 RepID=A0A6A4WIN7_AMPAM|nr:hypothetical protein FJT64_024534 [Amphibalanus amphitrite]